MAEYILIRGHLHERFAQSRAKFQVFGGGFGNGKTSACVMKALKLAIDYPGCNGLIARSTYPKLNDTIRKEFLKWCDKKWIESFPMSQNGSNTCTLRNGSQINFRYVAQQSRSLDSGTSNLLSATYDWIIVDQIEDPEIVHKDFLDLLGRLRGNAVYRGNDPSMPRTGPRWLMITCNPTSNWFYQEIVRPLKEYQETGVVSPSLLCLRSFDDNSPILDDEGKPQLQVELFEGSTHENRHILAADYIQGLESTYKGQMRDRYIKGEWAAYEGLVYPMFDSTQHGVTAHRLRQYLQRETDEGWELTPVEAYDHGLAVPSCYMRGFVDRHGNVLICGGFYKPEYEINQQAAHIRRLRREWAFGEGEDNLILADPSIFRRAPATARNGGVVGRTVAQMLSEVEPSLRFQRGNNDVINGVLKVQGYLNLREYKYHPITGTTPAPSLYYNLDLNFIADEASSYFWSTDTSGRRVDEPSDRSADHAMDCLKYLLSYRPNAAELRPQFTRNVPEYMKWHERSAQDDMEAA